MQEKAINRGAIIAEYLTGDYSYRQLGLKHGIDFRKIHYWVSNYKGKSKPSKKPAKTKEQSVVLPLEVKQLQAELRKTKHIFSAYAFLSICLIFLYKAVHIFFILLFYFFF
ncbi:MAG: hypothetical protein LC134_02130 [Chitinophagales bacterium]|nr:hypothetical protein [Chitinophagales bacterium]